MSHFCLLNDAETYRAESWDLLEDNAACQYWLDLFDRHFQETLVHAAGQYGRAADRHIEDAREQFAEIIRTLRATPDALDGALTVMALCRQREAVLRANRLHDPFARIKQRENESAIRLYPDVVRRLHAMAPDDRWLHLAECVFAGNIFDLGSSAAMNTAQTSPDFLATVEATKPRPWLVDDYDRLAEDLRQTFPARWGKAVIFVDNAGCDFILGIMPLARELALAGVQVVLAANELPSLNDITADETVEVIEQLADIDADLPALLDAQMFEVVSTGNDLPLIDLSDVSDELNAAAEDADLVILEGMGRSVESNFDATFKVDSLLLALLKDPKVAERVGRDVFDCVCKYQPVD
ncbi:hypothetical protein LCGC14_0304090 [marine sediment metagenome]|uniref:Damage-control phosphatase ARMT1-like metal-binding domain-containing protein n=1 Tax=marine sediment metagenome TaxID=412755 RepID=A0A0F9TUI5_9ZZZZ